MEDWNKPIIERDSINLDNIIYFTRYIIRRYYKLAIFFILLFFVYKAIQTPTYSSSISFYTNYAKSNQIPSSLGFITNLTGGAARDNQLGFSISDYINSESFVEDIVKQEFVIDGKSQMLSTYLGQDYDRIFSINPIGTLLNLNRHFRLSNSLSEEDKKFLFAKEVFLGSISYSESRETSLHKITISMSKYPLLSKQISESVYKSIINYSNQVTNIKGKEKRSFIEGRLLTVKADLEHAEEKMQTFRENNKVLNSPSLILKSDRLERDIRLYAQLYISLSDQLEIAKIDEKDFTSSVFLLDNAKLSFYKVGRSLLESIFLILVFIFVVTSSWELYKNRERLFK